MRPAVRVYLAVGALLLGLYGWSEAVGWERRAAATDRIAESVRQSPGGWRTWTFWHRGVRGGK
jgi:hypothetical protein